MLYEKEFESRIERRYSPNCFEKVGPIVMKIARVDRLQEAPEELSMLLAALLSKRVIAAGGAASICGMAVGMLFITVVLR